MNQAAELCCELLTIHTADVDLGKGHGVGKIHLHSFTFKQTFTYQELTVH